MSQDTFLQLIQDLDKDYDPNNVGKKTEFVDTGSYSLNAALSGSIWGGIPKTKIGVIAGEEATGKTFFTMGICKNFLQANTSAAVLYQDTEEAVTKEMISGRGIDGKRFFLRPTRTVEQFKIESIRFLDAYEKKDGKTPFMIVLDSVGMLPSEKELADALKGENIKDMTRAAQLKATFRLLTYPLGNLGVPLIVTNHIYANTSGYGETKAMSGGSGLKYAASWIIWLKKNKDVVGPSKEVVGAEIEVTIRKSRFTREYKVVKTYISHKTGLDRFYGLVDIALEAGVFKKVGNRVELPDGRKLYESEIENNPENYFTMDVLTEIDKGCKDIFALGDMVDLDDVLVNQEELDEHE